MLGSTVSRLDPQWGPCAGSRWPAAQSQPSSPAVEGTPIHPEDLWLLRPAPQPPARDTVCTMVSALSCWVKWTYAKLCLGGRGPRLVGLVRTGRFGKSQGASFAFGVSSRNSRKDGPQDGRFVNVRGGPWRIFRDRQRRGRCARRPANRAVPGSCWKPVMRQTRTFVYFPS